MTIGQLARFALLAALAAASLLGQSISGSIVGTVTDPADLAVVGAKATLTQVATGAVRSAVTDERGDFVFGTLQPGEYALKIEMAGFKSLQKLSIQLSAAERLPVGSLRLEVGAVAESVEVTAQGAVVQTASAERAGSITS
ncbi:MAG: carboxypeptidase regulatory-like domain-containing protein, partial [Acidimicrobiia bacterium]|nr:carboxypeptidase regulatory-like domain-containing protein [Acidimicrobiia bacterium]